jgi:hypothetical protein
MASAAPAPTDSDRIRRRGRRLGIALFVLVVAAFTGICSVQILVEVFGRHAGTPSAASCRRGLMTLIGAVRRARAAAEAETGGERAALARFRAELEPQWSERPALDATCRADAESLRAIGEIERLRYAEEHAVRYEAADLASRRRRVRALEQKLEHDESLTDARRDHLEPSLHE